ncbi:YaaC family protein [Streptomyces anulatus]
MNPQAGCHRKATALAKLGVRVMYSDLHAGEALERLRASRSNPPGKAADRGARRKTYAAALEQTGQMFRAAAVVGPATRPLQIFYGLSQAGRAIASAAVSLNGQDWRLESHGIKTTGRSGRWSVLLGRVSKVDLGL